MLQLPETIDFQAVNILLEKFRGVGDHDLPEVVTASWNIAGTALHMGLPLVVRENPMMVVSDKACIDEIEGVISDPDIDSIKKGILTEAAIAFLIKLAIKYLLKGA
jgi:hypothetical protein